MQLSAGAVGIGEVHVGIRLGRAGHASDGPQYSPPVLRALPEVKGPTVDHSACGPDEERHGDRPAPRTVIAGALAVSVLLGQDNFVWGLRKAQS